MINKIIIYEQFNLLQLMMISLPVNLKNYYKKVFHQKLAYIEKPSTYLPIVCVWTIEYIDISGL